MIFNRYKGKNWRLASGRSALRLIIFLESNTNAAAANEAQYFLKTYYRGPWRMIAALARRELTSSVLHYCWPTWEWLRVNVFRRPHDEVIETTSRAEEEEAAIEELTRELR